MQIKTRSLSFVLSAIAAIALFSAAPVRAAQPEVLLQTTKGPITIEMYPKNAPLSCANFLRLVKQHFYDGIIFHRVTDLGGPGLEHIAQVGDPSMRVSPPKNPKVNAGADNEIQGEFPNNGVANKLTHKSGAVAMARTNEPNSASSQIYICTNPCPDLDGSYAVFGYVVKGLGNAAKLEQPDPATGKPGDHIIKATVIGGK